MVRLQKIIFRRKNSPVLLGAGQLEQRLSVARLSPGTLAVPLAAPDDKVNYHVDLRGIQPEMAPYGTVRSREIGHFDYAWISRTNQVILASLWGEQRNTIPEDAVKFDETRTITGLLVLHDPEGRYDFRFTRDNVRGYVPEIVLFRKNHGGAWSSKAQVDGRTRALAAVYKPVASYSEIKIPGYSEGHK